MDFEAPVDAWYVWLGVVLGSVAVAGVAVGLPVTPPPDANAAANAIDRVAASTYEGAVSIEHDADAVKLGSRTIAMRNDGGTAHASVAVGSMFPVWAVDNATRREKLRRILRGRSPEAVLSPAERQSVRSWIATTNRRLDAVEPQWRPVTGPIRVRKVTVGGESLLLVGV